ARAGPLSAWGLSPPRATPPRPTARPRARAPRRGAPPPPPRGNPPRRPRRRVLSRERSRDPRRHVRHVPRLAALAARPEPAAPQGHREACRDAGEPHRRSRPVVQLPSWPDGDARTRIVVITRDLDPTAVCALFDAFLDAAAPDQPDRAALVDNPLVPFGGRDR